MEFSGNMRDTLAQATCRCIDKSMFLFAEGRDILIKAGTAKELAQFEGKIDRDVYKAALNIVTILDEAYGVDRDVDNGDGGFVLIAENVQDVSIIGKRYVKLDGNEHEAVNVVKCEKGVYIDALFLCNNEFGINVFMPMDRYSAACSFEGFASKKPSRLDEEELQCGISLEDSLAHWGF